MALQIEDFKSDFRFKVPYLEEGFSYVFDKRQEIGLCTSIGHLQYKDKHFANVEIKNGKVTFYSNTAGLSYTGEIDLSRFEKY